MGAQITQENTVTVNGRPIPIDGEKNLLELVRKAGIDLPTFCYHSELSAFGACRQCLVETTDGRILAGCSTPPAPGMSILTHTPRVQKIRKVALELLLANHDRECTTCKKSGSCNLQDLANRYNINEVRFGKRDEKLPLDLSSPSIVRDPNKCILCGDCVRMCREVQGIGVLDFAHRGSRMVVTPAFGKKLSEVDCVGCGQCAAVCPTGALTVKSQTSEAWDALNDKNKTVIVQIAPAVRVAIGEAFGMKPGEISLGKLVTALRMLGFNKVFDTCFTADLTVMEETSEFISRLQKGERLPQFTSCCPAWVKYAEQYCSDLLPNLSTCRSPQQMFGSLAKRFYAEQLKIKPEDLYVVSLMPCTAKKFEATRPEFTHNGVPDVDLVLTTQEIAHMIKEAGISFADLPEDSLDMPFGFTTGAGVLFGVTGGVAEAALRAAHYLITGEVLQDVNFTAVRGLDGLREAEVVVGGQTVRIAIINTLGQVKELIRRLRNGEVQYDLIEVMACPGGCIGGAGQIGQNTLETRSKRAAGIYKADTRMQLRRAEENPLVKNVYEQWLDRVGSPAAHAVLHTNFTERCRIHGENIDVTPGPQESEKLNVTVCVGTCCYLKGSSQILGSLTKQLDKSGLANQVNLQATFCLENCSGPASAKIGDKVIGGLTPNKVPTIMAEIEGQLQKTKTVRR